MLAYEKIRKQQKTKMEATTLIELENIVKTFSDGAGKDVEALKNVSVKIEDGDIYGIIGFSGAGKSTLVRCINLLEKPTSGNVKIDGLNITELSPRQLREERKKIGMIFQHFNLMPSRTVVDNIALPLKRSGLSKEEIYKRARNLLELVELSDKEKAYPAELSGGQKQRVAIARAILRKSPIIILDEATASVDVEPEQQIQQAISGISGSRTIIAIAHRLSTIRNADKILVIENGRVAESGTHEELVEKGGIYARMSRIQE
jgi:D-methionine transport system ATP-binding protein